MDLGFDTIGNATLICHDRGPVLATDPWLTGSAYFGSWCLSHVIPDEQLAAVKACRSIWISHGHPDHLSHESLALLRDKEILVPDHYGGRIRAELLADGFRVRVLADGVWYPLSERLRVLCISDYYQDAVLLVDLDGHLVVDANDASDRGVGAFLRDRVREFRASYLLALTGYGDADMINFVDEQGRRIEPAAARKEPLGPGIEGILNTFGIRHFVPFSSLHRYQRTDSMWANRYVTHPGEHARGFRSETAEVLPAFVHCDLGKGVVTSLDPPEAPAAEHEPEEFGDRWSDPLGRGDVAKLRDYFRPVSHLSRCLGYLNFRVGGRDHVIDIDRAAYDCGVTFEAPRNSLMTAIEQRTFDDVLIGNFMRTTLHGSWASEGAAALYREFTPFVCKFADNGGARSPDELRAYFAAYRRRGFFQLRGTFNEQIAAPAVERYL